MILTWMLYCTAVSALLGLGALALERGLAALGRPTRWAWAGAAALSGLLPFALPRLLDLRGARVAAGPAGGAIGELQAAPAAATAGPDPLRVADLLLLPAWAVASVALLLGAGALLAALHLRRRRWRAATVAGVPVLVSPRTGPAVVGFLRGRIVLPEWALGWDAERQGMMVEHEREHLRARDPLLLLAAFAAAALVPWNAALWWQLRRLRLAVEVDCDARVLRRAPDVRAYGLLLLEVGRVASAGRLPSVALIEPPSFLERRIRMMTSPRAERRLRRAVLAAAVCAGTVVLAAALPAPRSGVPGWDVQIGIDRQPTTAAADTLPLRPGVMDVGEATDKPRLANGEELMRAMRAAFPPVLRDAGIVGRAEVSMVVDESGAVAEAALVKATRPEFGEAAVAVMRQARFTPARKEGRPVTVRLVVPVAFTLENAPRPAGSGQAGEAAVDVGALDVKPRLLNAEEVMRVLTAGYPPLLRDAGIEGEAMVALVVDEQGAPRDVRLVSASRPEFGEPSLSAVRAMRFAPGAKAGRPTAARVQLPIRWAPPTAAAPAPVPNS